LKVAGVILAAGGSSRLGKPKQLLSYQGRPLIVHAVETVRAAGIDEIFVVTGSDASLVRESLATLDVHIVENDTWQDGISTSIRKGIGVIGEGVDGALLVLCDQPRIPSSHLEKLVQRFAANPETPVASGYSGTAGVPVIFPRRLFGSLLELSGAAGAKGILQREKTEVLPCVEAAIDIDEKSDLRFLL
jgi:CTP:molybdopterin cytidylyltransferase MocA